MERESTVTIAQSTSKFKVGDFVVKSIKQYVVEFQERVVVDTGDYTYPIEIVEDMGSGRYIGRIISNPDELMVKESDLKLATAEDFDRQVLGLIKEKLKLEEEYFENVQRISEHIEKVDEIRQRIG